MQTKAAIRDAEAHGRPSSKYPITPQKAQVKSTLDDVNRRATLFPPTPNQTPSRSLKRQFDSSCFDASPPTRSAKFQKLLPISQAYPHVPPTPTRKPSILHTLSIPEFSIAHPSNRRSYLGISGFELQRAMDVIMNQVDWLELGEEVGCNRKASVYKKAVKRLFQEKFDDIYDEEKVYGKGKLGGKQVRECEEDGMNNEDENELDDDGQDE